MATALRTRPVDEMMDALADEHRRRLLFELLEDGGWTEPRASRPTAGNRGDVASPTAMRHVHLPKLEGYDLVDWDRDADAVTTGPAFEGIRPLLEVMRDHEAELPIDCP